MATVVATGATCGLLVPRRTDRCMPRPRTLRPPFPPPSSINNERARARVSQRVRLLRRCGGRPLGYRAAGRAPGAPSSHQLVPQAHPAWPRRCRIRAARAALAHGALTNDGGGRRPLRETGPRRHRGAGASTPSRAPQRTRLRAARRHGANCRRMERGSGWSKRTIRRSPSRQRRGVSAIDPSARSSASASPGRPDAGGMPRGAAARQGTARAGAMPSDGASGRVVTSGTARGSPRAALGERKCCEQAHVLAPKRRCFIRRLPSRRISISVTQFFGVDLVSLSKSRPHCIRKARSGRNV